MKKGQWQTIYLNPLTQRNPEGVAKLIQCLQKTEGDAMERWRVRFNDGTTVDRKIKSTDHESIYLRTSRLINGWLAEHNLCDSYYATPAIAGGFGREYVSITPREEAFKRSGENFRQRCEAFAPIAERVEKALIAEGYTARRDNLEFIHTPILTA